MVTRRQVSNVAVDIVCYWSTLMNYAKLEAKARESGTPEELEEAVRQHEGYKNLCLQADSLIIDTGVPL